MSKVAPKELSASAIRFLPLALVATWWSVCFGSYIVAWPIDYTRINAPEVGALTGASLIAAVAGYWLSTYRQPFSRVSVGARRPLPRMVMIGLGASLLLVVPMSSAYSGYSVLEIGAAIQDQGGAFAQASQRITEGLEARTGVVLLQTVLAPFTLVVLPYLALAWFERREHGILLILGIAAPVVTSLLVGRDQQIGFSLIAIAGAWVVSRARRRLRLRGREVVFLGFAAIALMTGFGARKLARNPVDPICAPGAQSCTVPHSNPSLFDAMWVNVTSYATQGFEGLGRALDAVWVFGGGFSHSGAVQNILSNLFGFRPAPVVTTQLYSLGWSDSWYWSTGFTSLANDVPWVLLPLVILLQASLLGWAWRTAIRRGDWLSTAVLCYTWLALMFMPQNLQIAISGPTYLGYIALVVLFIGRAITERNSSKMPMPQVVSPGVLGNPRPIG
ncbi:hypothetical protein [Mycetocola zhujimingii]|uniref:hypothetical protein n=1 Tax=Mycetocola zhujimingii TaxID=2079792 RepID=UPI0013C53854|nr:hypothetical protein [Mycetocola zhujimingii]